jgi:hypothetical protein
VVDGSGLENRRTRKGTGGSNPSLSAIAFFILHLHHSDTCIDNEKKHQSGNHRVDEIAFRGEHLIGEYSPVAEYTPASYTGA